MKEKLKQRCPYVPKQYFLMHRLEAPQNKKKNKQRKMLATPKRQLKFIQRFSSRECPSPRQQKPKMVGGKI